MHIHSSHLCLKLGTVDFSVPSAVTVFRCSFNSGTAMASADVDETSSDEPWEKMKRKTSDDDDDDPWGETMRRRTRAVKTRTRRPQTPREQFLSGVAAMARASAKISMSMPGVAGSSTPLAGLASMLQEQEGSGVPVKPQQQQLQQQQPQLQQQQQWP